jgi:hypothetical protein
VSVVTLSANLPSPQLLGTSIVFTAAATGGVTPYEFKFLVGGAVAQDWSSSASFTWTPSAAGTYLVAVSVRSAGNTDDVAEQSASMSFTIQVVTPPPPPPPVHDNRDGCKPLPGDRNGKGAPDFSRGHKKDDCSDDTKDTKGSKDTKDRRDDDSKDRDDDSKDRDDDSKAVRDSRDRS